MHKNLIVRPVLLLGDAVPEPAVDQSHAEPVGSGRKEERLGPKLLGTKTRVLDGGRGTPERKRSLAILTEQQLGEQLPRLAGQVINSLRQAWTSRCFEFRALLVETLHH